MSATQYPIFYNPPRGEFKQYLGHGIARYGFFDFVNSDRVASDMGAYVQSNLPPQLRNLAVTYATQKKMSRKRGMKKRIVARLLQLLPVLAQTLSKTANSMMGPLLSTDGKAAWRNEVARDSSWGTATVKTDSLQGDLLWSTSVKLGSSSQTLQVNIDTGSSDLLVFDPTCETCALDSHAAFFFDKSSSFNMISNLTFSEIYADGSEAFGYLASDILGFGGSVKVQNQSFGMATDVSSHWQSQAVDGLMGLGPDSLSSFPWPHNRGVFTQLTESKALSQPVIGIALVKQAANTSGEFSFGKINSQWIRGGASQLAWKNVTSQNFWGTELSGIYVNNRNVMVSDDPPRAIIDTGTSLMLVTKSAAAAIHVQIPGAIINPSNDVWRLPCSTGSTDNNLIWKQPFGFPISLNLPILGGLLSPLGNIFGKRHRRFSDHKRAAVFPTFLGSKSPNIFIELGAGFRKFGIPASDLPYQAIPSDDPFARASDGKTAMCYSSIQIGADGFVVLGGTFIKNHYIALKQDKSGKSIGFGDRTDIPIIS